MKIATLLILAIIAAVTPAYAQPLVEELDSFPQWLSTDKQKSVRFVGRMQNKVRKTQPHRVETTRYVDFVRITATESSKDFPIFLENSDKAYIAVWPIGKKHQDDSYSITLPTTLVQEHRSLGLSEMMNLPRRGQVIVVDNPSQGKYSLTLTQKQSLSKVYAILVNTHSKLTLGAQLSRQYGFAGMPLTLSVDLQNDDMPIRGVQVEAHVYKRKPQNRKDIKHFSLKDDGLAGDVRANDGIYTLRKVLGEEIAEKPGQWIVRVAAHGKCPRTGSAFKRSARLSFRHCALRGLIGKPHREYQIRNRRGKWGHIVFKVPVHVYEPGKYRLFGVLSGKDRNNGRAIAWAMETREIKQQGSKMYFLSFPGADIRAANIAGPFRLDLQLFSLDHFEMAALPQADYRTFPYVVDNFAKNVAGKAKFDIEKMRQHKRRIVEQGNLK